VLVIPDLPAQSASLRRLLATAVAALAGAALIAVWLSQAKWQALLLQRWIYPAGLATAEALAAIGVSVFLHQLSRRLLRSAEASPDLATHLVLGLPLFGTLAFLVGLVSTAPAPMAAALALPAAGGAVIFWRRHPGISLGGAPGLTGFAAWGVLAIAAGVALLWATLPPATIDEVAYHLAVPKTWVLEGRALELPLLANSYFPFGVESAHLPALSLLGDRGALSAHLVHLAVTVAVLVLVVRWVSARASLGAGLLAAAALATPPALVTSAGLVWNEWPLLGASLILFFALERFAREEAQPATLALAVAAGMLTKYTFAPYAAALFTGALVLQRGKRPLLRALLLAAVAGGALGSVFYLRNLVWTGDPFAPFLKPLAPEVSHFSRAGSTAELLRRYLYDPQMMDESIGATLVLPVLVLVPAIGWLARDRFLRTASAVLAVATLLILRTGPSARLLVPFLASLAVVGVVALEQVPLRRVFRTLILAAAGFQVLEAAFFLSTFGPSSILQRAPDGGPRLAPKAFLAQRTENFHPAIDWINAALPLGSRVLVVGLHRLYWFSRPARGGGNFDGPRVAAYLGAESPVRLREKLRRDGITHVAIFKTLIKVGDAPLQGYPAESRTVFSPRGLALLREALAGGAKSIGSDAVAELYRLE
jgi:hypothetical protein